MNLPAADVLSGPVVTVPNDNPRYFFWNTGTGKPQSAVTNWQHDLRELFRAAGFPEGHPHQLRDTFAVRLLEKGVPMEEVSKALGHESIKTTEKYYAKWDRGRQNRLDSLIQSTWEGSVSAHRP
ncbi:MAG: site-specific integrase [Acidobacteriaceae bacterium]